MGYRNPGVRPVDADAIEARIAAGTSTWGRSSTGWRSGARPRINPGQAPRRPGAAASCSTRTGTRRARSPSSNGRSPSTNARRSPSSGPATQLALGGVLRRARRRREARAALQDAVDGFDAIGSPLWAARARAELARVGGRTGSGAALTGSEHRVAELVAQGMTNREVAEALFVSEHTVESHLSSAYRKLGVRSRTELASKLAPTAVNITDFRDSPPGGAA